MRSILALCALVGASVLAGTSVLSADASPPRRESGGGSGFLGHCAVVGGDTAKMRCYVRALLAHIEASGDPARELPRIDRKARAAGGFLAANCHLLMHSVGQKFARRHRLTLATLQRYVPKSNNPGCSAGFGMGLVIYLGPQIADFGARGAARACSGLPTRFRRYSCIHGLGHAYMRVFHGRLRNAVRACHALGLRHSPDCAQGAYHDHWTSLHGGDGAKRLRGAETSPRALCARQVRVFVRPCWYRVFLERPPRYRVETAAAIRRLCRGLRGLQRSGCISAAALLPSSGAIPRTRMCGRLRGSDIVDCLRAVPVQALAGHHPKPQLGLIRTCATLPRGAHAGCYRWFGKTLAVVTNGAFGKTGCQKLDGAGRELCLAGARQMHGPLVTFA